VVTVSGRIGFPFPSASTGTVPRTAQPHGASVIVASVVVRAKFGLVVFVRPFAARRRISPSRADGCRRQEGTSMPASRTPARRRATTQTRFAAPARSGAATTSARFLSLPSRHVLGLLAFQAATPLCKLPATRTRLSNAGCNNPGCAANTSFGVPTAKSTACPKPNSAARVPKAAGRSPAPSKSVTHHATTVEALKALLGKAFRANTLGRLSAYTIPYNST
jgi:hypothetical protein